MKHLFYLLLLLSTTVVCQAQVQNGIVKTNGRPDSSGIPLGNVAVKASGYNVSLSDDDGTFDIAMSGLKGGDSFFLTSVMKSGYELADRNAIGRKYGFSSSAPLVLTMVSKSELEKEKQRIRNHAIEATQKSYNSKVEELERELERHSITEEAFSEKLQELQKRMDQYIELAEDLADKYARTDYDVMDSLDRQINVAIENGLFDKADSLLHRKGDMDERHRKILDWNVSSKKQKEAIDRRLAQWETSESSRLAELENLAEDYYRSFTIEVSRMHPENAVTWLEKRLELDPERFHWLIETGRYYKSYMGNFNRALELFNRALKIAQTTKQTSQYISVFNEIGGVYTKLFEMKKAKEYYLEALRYAEKDENLYSQALASIYNNLGLIESENGNYDDALVFYNKSLSVAPDSLSESSIKTYANISSIYHDKNQMDLADVYLNRAIEDATRLNDKLILATCYSNKGVYCHGQGRDEEALQLYEKALKNQKEIFPPSHPSIASTLSNIAISYYSLSRIKESLNYTSQALAIYTEAYGEKHPDVARCFNSLSTTLVDAGVYDKALRFAEKSWEIDRVFYSESSDRYASYCNGMGRIYDGMKQDSLSLVYYTRALDTYEKIGKDKSSSYASVCNNVSTILTDRQQYDKAVDYNKKAQEIILSISGKENRAYQNCLNNLAYIFEKAGRKDKALDTYKEAEELIVKTYGNRHILLANNFNNVGNIYLDSKAYEKAREYFFKSKEICDSIYTRPNELAMTVLGNIAMSYYFDGKWKETIPWVEKAASIRLKLVSDIYRRYSYHTYIYNCYYQMSKNGEPEDIRKFKECQDTLWFNINVIPGGLASKKYGLEGDYTVLQYGNWKQGGELSMVEEITRMRNETVKDLLIYRDGKIEKLHFEEAKMGVNFYIIAKSKSDAEVIRQNFF